MYIKLMYVFHQVHGSRDSVVNIEIEGPSTSIGPSELVPPDTSRDLGSSPVEVIRYQPAQVEYHDIPSSSESGGALEGASLSSSPPATVAKEEEEEEEELLEGEQGERVGLVSGKDKTDGAGPPSGATKDKPCSLSSTSSESEANELQSLMQHAALPPSSASPSDSSNKQQGSTYVNVDVDHSPLSSS